MGDIIDLEDTVIHLFKYTTPSSLHIYSKTAMKPNGPKIFHRRQGL